MSSPSKPTGWDACSEAERKLQARWAFHDRCRAAEREAPKAWGLLEAKEVQGHWMVLRFKNGPTRRLEIPPFIRDDPWWPKDPYRPGADQKILPKPPVNTTAEAPQRPQERDHWGFCAPDQ